jgi:hypothetical protein
MTRTSRDWKQWQKATPHYRTRINSMGYFSNGTEGEHYYEKWCSRCVHRAGGCAVWFAHMTHNYKECNNKDSILHILIPRGKDGWNLKCKMFHPLKRHSKDMDLFDGKETK